MSNLLEQVVQDDLLVKAIEDAGILLAEVLSAGGAVFTCGNGGSMSDAMHLAEELNANFRTKRKALSAQAISDPAFLTCVANDFGFEKVFSRYLEANSNRGDLLVALSTSGNSANILEAAEKASELGLKVLGLTGNGGGKLANHCDIEIRVPHSGHSDRIQEIHIKVIHILIALVEKRLGFTPK